MRRFGLVRLLVVWLTVAALLYWARLLPVVYFKVPIISELVGSKLSIAGILWFALGVPLWLTWLSFPKIEHEDVQQGRPKHGVGG